MSDEGNDRWDPFQPGDRDRPVEPVSEESMRSDEGAAADEGPIEPASTERAAPEATGPEPRPVGDVDPESSSTFSNPMMPWIAVGIVLVIVIVILLVGRSDGGQAARDRRAPIPGPAEAPTEEQPKNACPGYELGTNLFGEPRTVADPGVHVWHDMQGFHLRLVPVPGSVEVVTGTVKARGAPLTLVEATDTITEADGTITFTVDGEQPEVHFKRSCRTTAVDFELEVDGAPLSAELVTVGNDGRPDTVPFTLHQLEG